MSTIMFTGFETGVDQELYSSITNLATIQKDVARNGGYALRVNKNGMTSGAAGLSAVDSSGRPHIANVSTSYVRFYFLYLVKPATGDEMLFSLTAQAPNFFKGELRLNSDGCLAYYDGIQNLRATGATPLLSGTWYCIEVKIDTGSTAPWEVKIDGAVEMGGLAWSQPLGAGLVHLGKYLNRHGQDVDFYYDDVLWSDSAYPGPGQSVALVPVANGAYTNGTPAGTNPAPTLWQSVNDLPYDGNATYINAIGDGNLCTFDVASFSDLLGGSDCVINSLKNFAVVNKDGTSSGNVVLVLRSGGSDVLFTGFATTSTLGAQKLFDADPSTGLPWTADSVDAAEVGIMDNSINPSRLLATYLLVDYQPLD